MVKYRGTSIELRILEGGKVTQKSIRLTLFQFLYDNKIWTHFWRYRYRMVFYKSSIYVFTSSLIYSFIYLSLTYKVDFPNNLNRATSRIIYKLKCNFFGLYTWWPTAKHAEAQNWVYHESCTVKRVGYSTTLVTRSTFSWIKSPSVKNLLVLTSSYSPRIKNSLFEDERHCLLGASHAGCFLAFIQIIFHCWFLHFIVEINK